MKLKPIFILMLVGVCVVACAPKVYIIDQATVLESEASGQWPEVHKEMRKNISKDGPSALKNREIDSKRDRAMKSLAGEMTEDKSKK